MEKDQFFTKMQIPTYLSWFFAFTVITTLILIIGVNLIYKRKKDKLELINIKKKTIFFSVLFIIILLLQVFISLDLFLLGDKFQVIKNPKFNPNFIPISISTIFTIIGFSSLFIKKESIKISFQRHFIAINQSLSLVIFILPDLVYGNRFEYNLLVFLYYLVTIITAQLLSFKVYKDLDFVEKTKLIVPMFLSLLLAFIFIYILNFTLTKYTKYVFNYSYIFENKYDFIQKDLYPIYSLSVIAILYFVKNYFSNIFNFLSNLKKQYINKNNISIYLAFLTIGLIYIHELIFFSRVSFSTTQFFELPLYLVILGRVSEIFFLIIFIYIIFLVFKTNKTRAIALFLIIFTLQFIFFSLVAIAKYGQMLFDYQNVDQAYNPAGDLSKYIFKENIIDVILKVKYIHFLPIFIFTISLFNNRQLIFYRKKEIVYITSFTHKLLFLTVLVFTHLLLVGFGYSTKNTKWHLESNRKLYTAQVSGLYNSYIYDLAFKQFNLYNNNLNIEKKDLEKYNKNKTTYTNIFGETYSNVLEFKDLAKGIQIDPKLTKGKTNLDGILKDKNLIVIQLESISELYLGLQEKSIYKNLNLLPNVFKVINQSLYFENYYDTTGFGWTMDADYSTHTGIQPTGNNTLYWELNNEKGMNTYIDYVLPKLFNRKNYNTISLVAAEPGFYNLNNIHKTYFDYNNFFFYSPEKYKKDKEYNLFLRDEWYKSITNNFPIDRNYFKQYKDELNDILIPNIIPSVLNEFNKNDQKYFILSHTSLPHVPFVSFEKTQEFSHKYQLTREYARIIDFFSYIDRFFFYIHNLAKKLDNVAFLIYGDHNPQGYPKEDLEYILGKKLSNSEYVEKAKRVLSLLYVPDKTRTDINNIPLGLIKGKQSLARSQVDNYRSIIEMFGLEKNHMYFGNHLLSNESNVIIDPKGHNIITDKFSINGQTTIKGFNKADIYYKKEEIDIKEIERIFKYTYNYKRVMESMYFDYKYNYLKLD